jgi:hypothetical protein
MITKFAQSKRRLLAIAVSSLIAVAATAVASGALAATHTPAVHGHLARRSAPRWPFSVFSRPARFRAHRADAGKVSAPQGGVLADVSQVAGVTNELYAWHKTPQEDCLVDVEGGSEITVACSPSAAAESEGISWVGTNSVVAMVPDGVTKVEVTSTTGSISTAAVVNNVTDDATQSNVEEFRYTMPNGTVVSRKGKGESLTPMG